VKYWTPQFIDVEDRIIGPLTIKQFVYIAGGIGSIILLNTVLPFPLAIIIGFPILALGGALAFYKVNNQPFIQVLEAAIQYFFHGRLYLWKKSTNTLQTKKQAVKEAVSPVLPTVPKLSESKLRDLSWSLDVKESSHSLKDSEPETGLLSPSLRTNIK